MRREICDRANYFGNLLGGIVVTNRAPLALVLVLDPTLYSLLGRRYLDCARVHYSVLSILRPVLSQALAALQIKLTVALLTSAPRVAFDAAGRAFLAKGLGLEEEGWEAFVAP